MQCDSIAAILKKQKRFARIKTNNQKTKHLIDHTTGEQSHKKRKLRKLIFIRNNILLHLQKE